MKFNIDLPFKKKKKNLTLTLNEVKRETEKAVTLIFDDDEACKYLPGQYLTLIMKIDGKEERRSYSICSTPKTENGISVTVKEITGGKVSGFINRNVAKGQTIEILAPEGNFLLPDDHQGHLVFIAAGSGITPVFSMIKEVLHHLENDVTLIYGNRNESSVIFGSELRQLAEKFADRFTLIETLSQPSENWNGLKGRINHELLKNNLQRLNNDAFYYLCGPEELMKTTKEFLLKSGVTDKKIKQEKFVTSKKEPEMNGEEQIIERQVTVIVDGEEHQVIVKPDETILEAALDDDIDMPFSCQSGICTTCRGKLISGKVSMEEDEGLSPEEIENGYVLNCVGHPLTDDVKIEIG